MLATMWPDDMFWPFSDVAVRAMTWIFENADVSSLVNMVLIIFEKILCLLECYLQHWRVTYDVCSNILMFSKTLLVVFLLMVYCPRHVHNKHHF
jgi:hypothetical protein